MEMQNKYTVKATMGMSLGQTLVFEKYEDASDFAHLMCQNQPIGKIEVVTNEGQVAWSYEKLGAKVNFKT